MNLMFYMALRDIPFGLAVAIEFSGPLAVAIYYSRRALDFVWLALAVLGLALILPLGGNASGLNLSPVGIACALGAAVCWASYIVLGRRLGHIPSGQAVSLGLLCAALVVVPFGVAEAGLKLLTPSILLFGLMVAAISSALPYSLEMLALRRLPPATFGIALATEPAIAALMGMLLLSEHLTLTQWTAIACIMAAAMGSAMTRLQAGGFSIGIEAPLDNDWTPLGEQARRAARRLPGEPDLQRHAELARLADRLGFRALWVRDVPVYDPAFGDAAQVFEVFSYLGYLAGITNDILLGTGAVVLPIREPLLTLKSARSVQRLSGDRLLLGVASGDRPVEYPLFSRDFDTRGSRFREQIALLREGAASHLPQGLDVLPADGPALPLFVAGLAQQQPAWIGQHMDGCLAYPGTPQDHAQRVAAWRAVAGNKPYASFIHLDLVADADAPLQRWRFGLRGGRNALLAELHAMQAAGVDHIGLQFRRNERPLAETFHEIAEYVLPHFPAHARAAATA